MTSSTNEFLTALYQNPYPIYRRLRDEDPVHFSEALNAWLLTRYADVTAALRDPSLSARRAQTYTDRLPADLQASLARFGESLRLWLLFQDSPEHARLRGLVARAFTPAMVNGRRPRIEALVEELLAAARARGSLDVVKDLAMPLPAMVIADVLGAERADWDRMRSWSYALIAFIGRGAQSPELARSSLASWEEMVDYLGHLAAARRASPRDDLVSALLAAEQDSRVTHEELIATCVLLLFAGHETTTNLIGNGTLALLRHPAELARLREAPGLLPAAVEELIRYDSPVQTASRMTTTAIAFGGKTIPPGQRVISLLGAANRDPIQFEAPETLDVGRTDNKHLGLGFGAHFCLGAPLARLEAQAVFAALARMPRLELAGADLRWRENLTFRGLESLPVSLGA